MAGVRELGSCFLSTRARQMRPGFTSVGTRDGELTGKARRTRIWDRGTEWASSQRRGARKASTRRIVQVG